MSFVTHESEAVLDAVGLELCTALCLIVIIDDISPRTALGAVSVEQIASLQGVVPVMGLAAGVRVHNYGFQLRLALQSVQHPQFLLADGFSPLGRVVALAFAYILPHLPRTLGGCRAGSLAAYAVIVAVLLTRPLAGLSLS